MFSPDSAAKTCAPEPAKRIKHVTMKCGWICLDCKKVGCRLKELQSQLCKGFRLHRRVLQAGYMCQACPAISDDISTFIHEECPCSFDESKIASPAYATPPAARPAEGASPESARAVLSIRKRAGRIGGEYIEVPHVPPESVERAPKATEPTKSSMPEGLLEPEHPKPSPKQTWTDLPTKAAGSTQPAKHPSADDSKISGEYEPDAQRPSGATCSPYARA